MPVVARGWRRWPARSHRERQPELDTTPRFVAELGDVQATEPLGCNTDHGERASAYRNRMPDDVRTGMEAALPEQEAHHHDGLRARAIVARVQRPACRRTAAEHREIVPGDECRRGGEGVAIGRGRHSQRAFGREGRARLSVWRGAGHPPCSRPLERQSWARGRRVPVAPRQSLARIDPAGVQALMGAASELLIARRDGEPGAFDRLVEPWLREAMGGAPPAAPPAG